MEGTIECPQCGQDMHFDILDEDGAHYECPNCDYEWCDTSVTTEEVDGED